MSFGDKFLKGTNFLVATFWSGIGVMAIIAGASGYGGAMTILGGIGALLYGLYGYYALIF